MRIWDIDPGYLNRQSLLGEHRELHGIFSIIVKKKQGYSKHPETLRWVGRLRALERRHKQLSCEMTFRGYLEKSPVLIEEYDCPPAQWPDLFVDPPGEQLRLLGEKYRHKEEGRIPLPQNIQDLWNHYQFSIMARDEELYYRTAEKVSHSCISFDELAMLLVMTLRRRPQRKLLDKVVELMGAYIFNSSSKFSAFGSSWKALLEIRKRVIERNIFPLLHSTAINELLLWLEEME